MIALLCSAISSKEAAAAPSSVHGPSWGKKYVTASGAAVTLAAIRSQWSGVEVERGEHNFEPMKEGHSSGKESPAIFIAEGHIWQFLFFILRRHLLNGQTWSLSVWAFPASSQWRRRSFSGKLALFLPSFLPSSLRERERKGDRTVERRKEEKEEGRGVYHRSKT